jgi:site-specific recombinase XerD
MATTQTVPQALSTEQVKAILKEARKSSTRDWCMFLLTFRHALRSQEVRQFRLADIDITNGTVSISRVKGSKSSVQALDRHKGEPLLDSVFAMRLWQKERVEDGSQILFPSQKGGMMTRMQLLRLFKKYAMAAGVTEDLAHPHILRHSLCTVIDRPPNS